MGLVKSLVVPLDSQPGSLTGKLEFLAGLTERRRTES
jgi:hypothetical protein